jgi:hypothetical protein
VFSPLPSYQPCHHSCPTLSYTDNAVSTATPKTGTTPANIDEEMKEIMLHFEIQPKIGDAAKKVAVVKTPSVQDQRSLQGQRRHLQQQREAK